TPLVHTIRIRRASIGGCFVMSSTSQRLVVTATLVILLCSPGRYRRPHRPAEALVPAGRAGCPGEQGRRRRGPGRRPCRQGEASRGHGLRVDERAPDDRDRHATRPPL